MFKKNKKIKVKAVTNDAAAFKYSRPVLAEKLFPEWYKTLPKYEEETLFGLEDDEINMRGCAGFIGMQKIGFVLPMWSDIAINVLSDGGYSYRYADGKSHAEHHDLKQINNFWSYSDVQHLKLVSPWVFSCDEPVDFLMQGMPYHNSTPLDYVGLQGLFNPYYTKQGNLQLLLKRNLEKDSSYFIKANTPMAQFLPLFQQEIELDVLYDPALFKQETDSAAKNTFVFSGLKKMKKCPFSLLRGNA